MPSETLNFDLVQEQAIIHWKNSGLILLPTNPAHPGEPGNNQLENFGSYNFRKHEPWLELITGPV